MHWLDTVLPLYDAAVTNGHLLDGPISTVALHQVPSLAELRGGGGMGTDWFYGVLRIAVDAQRARAAAPAASSSAPAEDVAFLFADRFRSGVVCFEEVAMVAKDLKQPHLCSEEAAAAFRASASKSLRLPPPLGAPAAPDDAVTANDGGGGGLLRREVLLALRDDERRFLKEEALVSGLRQLLKRRGYALRTMRPKAEPLRTQARVPRAATATLTHCASHPQP